MVASVDDGPAPGDPASPGPRPPADARDMAWAGAATVLSLVTGVQFAALAVALLRTDARLSSGGMVLGFVITVVWLLTISWLVLGCWRRTVWGCPFDHLRSAPDSRRCQRHRVLESPPDRTDD